MVRAYQENAEEVSSALIYPYGLSNLFHRYIVYTHKDIHRALQIEFVIMVNCGATMDIVDILQPEEKVIFFILDSHRPYDLCNVYNEAQVQILGDINPDEEIPEYNDVFNDESVSY